MPHRLQDSFFRALFDSPVAGIAVGDLATKSIIAVNSAMLEILGRSREEVEGIPSVWRDMTPPEHQALDDRALAQFVERGHSDPFEKEYIRPDGSRVPVRVSVSKVENHPDKMIVLVNDISEERAAKEREDTIRARLEIALSAADQGIWDWDLVTGEMVYSDRAKAIYGLPVDQPVTFEIIRDATHPEDYPNTSALLKRAIDPAIRDRSSYEYRIVRPDGSICWALAFGEAVFEGERGSERAVRYAGTLQDITERKRAERHREILVAELNHRVKNTLAIVQSLAHQTLKGAVAAGVAHSFNGRLAALAAAHDILTKGRWEAANFRDIAASVLNPHAFPGGERIRLSGDDARLYPQVAVNLAMALHELATNAAKYGGLSNETGRVDVSWNLVTQSQPRLHVHWRESGGPTVKAPTRQGFGTRMLKRILGTDGQGAVELDFRPEGLHCSIEAPAVEPA